MINQLLTSTICRRYHICIKSCVLLLLVSAAGCSDKIAVTGQVSVDNEPVTDGTIDFYPMDGKGPNAGNIIDQGQYRVEMLPGKKRVRIQGFKTVGTKKVQFSPTATLDAPIKEAIVPKRYNVESNLEVEVDGSHRIHDFALEADNPKRR
jgi:hypothetical protein